MQQAIEQKVGSAALIELQLSRLRALSATVAEMMHKSDPTLPPPFPMPKPQPKAKAKAKPKAKPKEPQPEEPQP